MKFGCLDFVRVHCDFVLGRPEAVDGVGLRALVLGCDALPSCPAHCPWQGCFGFRVRVAHPVLPSHFTDMTISLWTKYTVAGEHTSFSMNYFFYSPDIFSLAIPGSFVFTMLFLPLYAVVAPAIGFSTEFYGLVPRLWTDAVFYFVLLLVPIVCLTRDFAWK